MVDYQDALDATFAALSDRTRRAMVARLAEGGSTVKELAEPFDMSLQAVSKHLAVLERAGLVQKTRRGRLQLCRIDAGPLRDAVDWMERYRKFWESRLDALAEFVSEEP
jgi:DNA-binding transcriptional ArsR family regulator